VKNRNNIIIKENFKKLGKNKFKKQIKNQLKLLSQNLNYNQDTFFFLSKNFELDFTSQDISKFKRFQTIVILGIGGSILGSKAIYNFFQSKIKKNILFFDNLDSSNIQKETKKINFKKSLFVIISKSGNTLETLSMINLLKNKKIDKKNAIVITERKNSPLSNFCRKFNILMIEHKKYIGGRYSVLSEVGMLPAYLMGLNIKRFRKNTFHILEKNKNILMKILPTMLKIYSSKKYSAIVFLNYSPRLDNFLFWLQQLIAESLGKKGKGLLPVISTTPKDHHSLLQLYLDGPKDKIFYFLSEKVLKNNKIKNNFFGDNFHKTKNKGLNQIVEAQKNAVIKVFKKKKIPFREFELRNFNEETLGEFFSYFMIETVLIGKLLNIDPFNQPAVEDVKTETIKNLI
tara:strand:+ start:1082 stop:2284 length:1203 start_codon:yes stop_codon:yes gene_type:complete